MHSPLSSAVDARQSREWGIFLEQIGWKVEIIDGIYIFIRTIPFLNRTIIKIQHPKGPLPFRKLETLAKRNKALCIILEPHISGFAAEKFTRYGYRISKLRFAHTATILIDLQQSCNDLWKSFSENVRRNIRKAEMRVTIRVVPLGTDDDHRYIEEFYTFYSELGKMKKFYVPSYHEVRAKITAFKETSVMFFAYEKEQPIAVLWVGAVGNTLIYFHPGNSERGYELFANHLLVWEAIKYGKQKGLAFFDFETAYDSRYPWENKQWKGYTEFKKKFGGELISFPPGYIRFYSPMFKYFYFLATVFSK
jgi:lipid II:glycine glycyltransferase (peptidoglycan interpeptide bridge formation enzyme)